jgi:hypothetical protein
MWVGVVNDPLSTDHCPTVHSPSAPQMTEAFVAALHSLTGAARSIKAAADWFEHAPARAPALSSALCAHAASEPSFDVRLRLVYVANDVLFASQRKGLNDGGVRDALAARLPHLLSSASAAAADAASRSRLAMLVDFWVERGVVDAEAAHALHACVAAQPAVPAAPQSAVLPHSAQAAPPLGQAPAPDPQFAAGVLPALVRRRRGTPPYTPLSREEVGMPACTSACRDMEAYHNVRVDWFYERLAAGAHRGYGLPSMCAPHTAREAVLTRPLTRPRAANAAGNNGTCRRNERSCERSAGSARSSTLPRTHSPTAP